MFSLHSGMDRVGANLGPNPRRK